MFSEYKYKTELHAHTSPASGCSKIPPEELVGMYKDAGYTSLAVTNHFIFEKEANPDEKILAYLDDFNRAKKEGERLGINIILGSEIRFSENVNDYLIFGIDEADLFSINALLDDGIDNFYKKFKNEKNVIIQAHPFRDGMTEVNPKSIDGIEVFNVHPHHNSRIGLAAQYAKENGLLVTAGTDCHDPGWQALSAIVTKTEIKDSFELADIIKKQDFVISFSGFITCVK